MFQPDFFALDGDDGARYARTTRVENCAGNGHDRWLRVMARRVGKDAPLDTAGEAVPPSWRREFRRSGPRGIPESLYELIRFKYIELAVP